MPQAFDLGCLKEPFRLKNRRPAADAQDFRLAIKTGYPLVSLTTIL